MVDGSGGTEGGLEDVDGVEDVEGVEDVDDWVVVGGTLVVEVDDVVVGGVGLEWLKECVVCWVGRADDDEASLLGIGTDGDMC